jgi:hypothetical protein
MFYKKTIGTAGTATSAVNPLEDISTGRAYKFNVSFNAGAPITASLPVAGCTSGALIAGAIQTTLQAVLTDNSIGGTVTCAFAGGVYVITYTGLEVSNSVVITNAATNNCATLLKLGVANGGTEVAGAAATSTSNAAPVTQLAISLDTTLQVALNGQAAVNVILAVTGKTTGALTAAELQTKINAALVAGGKTGGVTVTFTGGKYVLTSSTVGLASAVVITDGATNNVADDLKLGAANAGIELLGERICKICDNTYPNVNVQCAAAKELNFYKDAAKTQPLFSHVAGVLSSSYEGHNNIVGAIYAEALEDNVSVTINLW